MQELVTTDLIISYLKERVEKKEPIDRQVWLDAAFKLNLLLADEHYDLQNMRAEVAKKRLGILQAQEKKNVSMAEVEVEASDEYRLMKLQEHKVERIEEMIRLAKKNTQW